MSSPDLAAPSRSEQRGHMSEPSTVLETILDEAPGSIRDLAREADVSHSLLVAVRDGERRLTSRTRDRVAAALRQWSQRCGELAEELEAADTDPGGDDDG